VQVNNLKSYLANIGMTVREFSEIIDVGETYLSAIIHGSRIPSPRLAKDIFEATDGLISVTTRMRKKDKKREQAQDEQQQQIAV
jgi:transcriptional regulator with XRE-family HTH domain